MFWSITTAIQPLFVCDGKSCVKTYDMEICHSDQTEIKMIRKFVGMQNVDRQVRQI